MLTQQEFVEGCYAYYAENYIEPGNPEDGVWEDAHHPVPECKGGKVTIPLLQQHHAIHNVIQSEEVQYPCIWGWEADYLTGELLELCKKWHTKKSKIANQIRMETTTQEQRSEDARRSSTTRLKNSTPEQRSELTRKARQTYLKNSTPEQRSEAARKREANKTPEQRSEAAKKSNANRNRSVTKCDKAGQAP